VIVERAGRGQVFLLFQTIRVTVRLGLVLYTCDRETSTFREFSKPRNESQSYRRGTIISRPWVHQRFTQEAKVRELRG
jgi:hypothetical protein